MELAIERILNALAPWVAIAVTLYVAMRVQAVHRLVNSEMDAFRAALKHLAEAKEAEVFQSGQQNIRDANRETLSEAARATVAAARATTAAAEAITPSNGEPH